MKIIILMLFLISIVAVNAEEITTEAVKDFKTIDATKCSYAKSTGMYDNQHKFVMYKGGMNKMGFGLGAGIICFAIASFIFSIIFWLTYNWIGKKK